MSASCVWVWLGITNRLYIGNATEYMSGIDTNGSQCICRCHVDSVILMEGYHMTQYYVMARSTVVIGWCDVSGY